MPMAGEQLKQMIDGYKLSQAICVAAELRLADELGAQGAHFEALAARTGAHAPSLLRLLRALAAAGIVSDADAGRFRVTPLGGLLRQGADGSLHAWARFGLSAYEPWGRLLHSVRTGREALGKDRWRQLSDSTAESRRFNEAMAEASSQVAPELLRAADFSAFGCIVDIGGGDATLLSALLQACPGAQGVLLELPEALRDARLRIERAAVAERCRLVEGSFFDAVPGGGDAYLLSRVLHDWNDERAAAILCNIRRVAHSGAAVFIIERLVDLPVPGLETALSDLNMMVMNGGRERTRAEFERLLERSGMRLARVSVTASPLRILQAHPA